MSFRAFPIDPHRSSTSIRYKRILAAFGALQALCASMAFAADAVAPPRPSLLLIVLDTVRADAVSAYGKVEGTTPAFDALAAKGIRYTAAFSAAPWTLPSHATIFTGRRVDEHRVAMPGQPELPIEFETLAEQLGQAGYETAAFSENVVVSDAFELLRGFEVRKATTIDSENKEQLVDAWLAFRDWLAQRDASRPFFAFVNILDAHRPYTVRTENPWVPESAKDWDVKDRLQQPERQICGALPTAEQVEILRGLYLGDVHAADEKLGKIVAAARAATVGQPLITLATSDHGELFGEHQLLGHEFSLHAALLSVPLVVQGFGEKGAIVVSTPVGLEDVMPTMLAWAKAELPDGLQGIALPISDSAGEAEAKSRVFFSAFSDQFVAVPKKWHEQVAPADLDKLRQFCSDSNRVFGGMAALIRHPFKYVWYERYPASLYDLSWDPEERSDQAKYRDDLLKSLETEMKPLREASGVVGGNDSQTDLSPDALEALKKLGYVE